MRHGNLIRPAAWKKIITEQQWLRLNEIFDRRIVEHDGDILRVERIKKPSRRDFKRVGVLSGFLWSEHGNPMSAVTRGGYELYSANAPSDYTSVRRDVLEDFVFGCIASELVRLESRPLPEWFQKFEIESVRTPEDIEADLAEVEMTLDSYAALMRGKSKPSASVQSLINDALQSEERLRAELAVSGSPLLSPVETEPEDPINDLFIGGPDHIDVPRPMAGTGLTFTRSEH